MANPRPTQTARATMRSRPEPPRSGGSGILIPLLVLAVVGFFVYPKAKAWYDEQTGAAEEAPGGVVVPADCVRCAAQARLTKLALENGADRFRNAPFPAKEWESFRTDIQKRIHRTNPLCRSKTDSCKKGAAALRKIRDLITELDSSNRSGVAVSVETGPQLEEIEKAVAEAEAAARSGS